MVYTYSKHLRSNDAHIGNAPSGAVMATSPHILFDGKTLGADRADRWSVAGTGTQTFQSNKALLEVDSGEYHVRQSVYPVPYYAGYTSFAEFTFDNFGIEAGVTKRVGQFSTSTVAPYTATTDGYYLENDGTTYRIKAFSAGTVTVDIPMHKWINYQLVKDYDFDKFTTIMFDFLWLGGAALRLWLMHPEAGWILCHAVPYVGNAQGTIFQHPQQPLRYEIRGDSAAGSFRPICCQASVQNDIAASGNQKFTRNTANVACNTAGTIYALLGLKKRSANLQLGAQLNFIGSGTTNQNDIGLLYMLKNPTLSAGLTYADINGVQAAAAGSETVTDVGEVLSVFPATQGGDITIPADYGSWLTHKVDGTLDEFVLAFEPLTANQNRRGVIGWKEYG